MKNGHKGYGFLFSIELANLSLSTRRNFDDLPRIMQPLTNTINYTNSLVNADSFYANITNMTFQKIPSPHLTRMTYYETNFFTNADFS